MSVEVADVIADLDESWPLGGDGINESDDHHRLTKHVLKNQFPGELGNGLTRPVTCTEDEFDYLKGVTSSIQDQINNIGNILYPVGAIYMSTVDINPDAIFGGTWQSMSDGRVLISQNGSYPAGSTGGSKDAVVVSHNHSAFFTGVPLPNHQHGLPTRNVFANLAAGARSLDPDNVRSRTDLTDAASGGTPSGTVTVNSQGSSGTDKNMQPYLSVYMWKRTA